MSRVFCHGIIFSTAVGGSLTVSITNLYTSGWGTAGGTNCYRFANSAEANEAWEAAGGAGSKAGRLQEALDRTKIMGWMVPAGGRSTRMVVWRASTLADF